MDNLGDLLGKFRRSLDKDAETREIVSAVIKGALGFEIRLADISTKGHVLYIKTSPAKRSEISLSEKKILSEIRSRTGLRLDRIAY